MGMKTATSSVLGATILAWVLGASAAPSSPAPGPTPAPSLRPAPEIAQAPKTLTVDVSTTVIAKCGEGFKEPVTLKSTKLQEVRIFLLKNGAGKMKKVTLLPGNVTVLVDTADPVDCTKPLGTYEVKVTPEDSETVLFKKTIRPTTVKAEQGFAAPSEPTPWLRRVTLSGTCGGSFVGTMGLHTLSPTPQPAHVKLALGAATKDETVQAASTNTFVSVETAVTDCTTTAPPAFDYALLDGHPRSGKLVATEVAFAPL